MDGTVTLIVVLVIVVLVAVTLIRAVQIIPQATAAVIERLGRYKATQPPGLTFLVPFVDRIRERIDLREQVVSFPPQPVITQDNLTVNIDTVVYFQVTDPRSAVYEISDYIVGVEQITTTTLRNVVGGMTLEETLTSRDAINTQLRGELDEATGRWGIRVARVEIKAIDPPPSIQESMERQMKADREKRAMILTAEGERESAIRSAEGQKQSQILTAEGAKQAAILNAEADRQSRILRAQGDRAARYLQAQGQAKAIEKVFAAIKAGKPTPELLAYQYLQTLPQMAQGDANKVWLVPSDFGKALEGFTRMLGAPGDDGVFRYQPSPDDGAPANRPEDDDPGLEGWFDTRTNPEIAAVVANAEAQAWQEVPPLGAEPSAIPGAPGRLGPGEGGQQAQQRRTPPSPAPRREAPREIERGDWDDEGQSSVPTPPRGTPAQADEEPRRDDEGGSGLPGYPAPPPPH
ncbi:MAG: SPFH/Band 7/PHB domain protein [Pseudonocardia sp.]|uniref:SPFH domain-containing protein n=1 Tax=unclassified Pseudonocardia TaxID=2619320 RepID=UPI00086DDBAD|nr:MULTISPECIES: SPFH domain-containing protein [unclassified Pseudonocardia]MBN9112547.1 SPFH/Band 7/PHB domain protein [Pseudonocardia sp.]ODV07064.1 MAG: stomatin family protein [Pseudonocardia sp. SCN 73-27]